MWPLIAMGGLSLLGQIQQNKSNARQTKQENKAILEANQKNLATTMFRVGMLNVQEADQKKILAQRRADLFAQEQQTAGATANNAAASGTVGASVDAVQSDIALQFEKAQAQITEDNLRNIDNYNVQLHDLIEDGQRSMGSLRPLNQVGMGEMLLNSAISVGSIYAQSKLQLGLGRSGV